MRLIFIASSKKNICLILTAKLLFHLKIGKHQARTFFYFCTLDTNIGMISVSRAAEDVSLQSQHTFAGARGSAPGHNPVCHQIVVTL